MKFLHSFRRLVFFGARSRKTFNGHGGGGVHYLAFRKFREANLPPWRVIHTDGTYAFTLASCYYFRLFFSVPEISIEFNTGLRYSPETLRRVICFRRFVFLTASRSSRPAVLYIYTPACLGVVRE